MLLELISSSKQQKLPTTYSSTNWDVRDKKFWQTYKIFQVAKIISTFYMNR